ncbi:MAG: hypothetical protein H6590_08090 [Flavobacteriales bacterium]|nr:hypothetical protein [Flavobacteriales bacterium]
MGEGPTDRQEAYLNQRLKLYDLQGADLQVRTGLLLGKQEEDPVLQQRMDEQRRMMGQLAALQDSLIRKDAFRSLLQREAQAVDTGIQWLVVMDVPGRADSLPQLVSARFDHYPDSTRIARLQRWIDTKFDKPGQLIIDTLR